jgi:hypothetical protein
VLSACILNVCDTSILLVTLTVQRVTLMSTFSSRSGIRFPMYGAGWCSMEGFRLCVHVCFDTGLLLQPTVSLYFSQTQHLLLWSQSKWLLWSQRGNKLSDFPLPSQSICLFHPCNQDEFLSFSFTWGEREEAAEMHFDILSKLRGKNISLEYRQV